MLKVSNFYIAVAKPAEKPKEGFQTVELIDSSAFTGVVYALPEAPVYMGNTPLEIGNTVLFAKYSPDTHEIDYEGQKIKFINIKDILGVL